MSFKLAAKEVLRNKSRYVAIASIVALTTLLVLLQVSMSEGLKLASSQYIAGIDAELMLFRDKAKRSIPASSLRSSQLNDVSRVEGVEAVGPIGFATASILLKKGTAAENLEVALVGVEPGMPGAPSVVAGTELTDGRAMEVVLDQNVLDRVNIPLGAPISLEVLQGTEDVVYTLMVVGHTSGSMYNLPSIFVPLRVWDKIKPQEQRGGGGEVIFNVAAVKLKNPDAWRQTADSIQGQVRGIEATDLTTAYESLPGYREMQDIITMQQVLITLAALLVIGGFFQIQALQRIAHVGMLKAIGASNRLITSTVLVQVMLTTLAGIVVGGAAVWGITALLPPTVPIVFNGPKVATGVVTLLLMGPAASLVAVRTLLRVEPLRALGLAR
jgi:putative ABC transport system permease protein